MKTSDLPSDYSRANHCAICDVELKDPIVLSGEWWLVPCPNCGDHKLTDTAYSTLAGYKSTKPERAPLLAHLIRQRERAGTRTAVDSALVERAFSHEVPFPNAFAQVENLVIWLAENLPHPGAPIDIEYERFQAVIGAAGHNEFSWVVSSAREQGWVDGVSAEAMGGPTALLHASLTLDGWRWYEEVGRKKRSRIAFMAMKFGDKVLDKVVRDHWAPAVAQAGFSLHRLDDQPEAGLIDNRLRVDIRRSRLLIADLTHGNAGAYWEAGFAEGLGLPVIYTCRDGVKTHFDTRNCQTVFWSADDPADSAEQLKATIRNSLPDEARLEDEA